MLHVYRVQISRKLNETISLAGTISSTSIYTAPEIHRGKKIGPMADMWSLGVTLFEIITYKKPFNGDNWFVELMQEKLCQILSFLKKVFLDLTILTIKL